LALPFFTGMVATFTAEQRPLSRQFDWPFSPEYQGDAPAIWNGVINELEIFTLALRSTTTIHCATMAYGFHLVVQGLGTNGYGINFEMKRAYGETNLIVTEI